MDFISKIRLPGLSKGSYKTIGWLLLGIVGTYLLISLFFMWWWDYEPEFFDVVSQSESRAEAKGESVVTGYVTTSTVAELMETLLEKRGGFLSNDVFPAGAWMDNVPNWEFGVLVQIRDFGRALRIDFSRSQSQSNEDPDLSEAEGKFFYDNTSWVFPQSESEYRQGIEHLEGYLTRLSQEDTPDAQFYARADNLRNWLEGVSTRLGGLSQRLSESVGKRQLNLAVAGDPNAQVATDIPEEQIIKTPWTKIDDVFYESRGQAWALIHLLKAVEHDFEYVLRDKNALVSLRQIIRDLEETQSTVWSPAILNGGGFGLWANHSLAMAAYISRVNAALIDLRLLLTQG
ncbi:MAG: DUF2333 family protein [Gammaproteobacteria bacterium]|nr:DUF2333 family protein [Gammaproteobacteria bacterium]